MKRSMLSRLMTRLRPVQEEGSALILALVVILVLGITVAAALEFAGSSLQTTTQLRDLRNQTNYVQTAVDGAINKIRGSSTAGGFNPVNGQPYPCVDFNPQTPSNDPGADGSTQYNVTCTPKTLPGGGGQNQSVPTFAVLTLGAHDSACSSGNSNSKCVGFNDISGNNTMQVLGGLFSNGDITVGGGNKNNIFVEGSAYGVGPVCDISLIHTSDALGPQCPNYVDSGNLGADPKYAAAIGDDTTANGFTGLGQSTQTLGSTTKDPLPTCSGSIATFSPGYYSVIPDELLDHPKASGCHNFSGVENFTAGNYYFDFPQTDSTWNPDGIIGGALPAGFDPAHIDWTAACDSTKAGVEFEFGGASAIDLPVGGQISLCGPNPNATHAYEDVAIYGLSTNNVNALTSPPTATDNLYAANQDPINTNPLSGSGAGPQFAPEGTLVPLCPTCVPNAKTVGDTNTASVTLDSTVKVNNKFVLQSAGLNYSGFANVPDGAQVNSLAVCVADTPDSNATTDVQVTLPGAQTTSGNDIKVPATAASLSATFAACTAGMHLYTVSASDLAKVLPDKPQWREAQKLTVTYTVTETGNHTGTSTIDGLSLDINYTAPALEVQHPNNTTAKSECTNVTTTRNFLCATQPANSKGAFVTTGTVYIPSQDMIVETQNGGSVLFARGVIAYSLTLNDNASFKQIDPPFQIPGSTPVLGRLVLFTATVNNVVKVRACVKYVDQIDYADPALPDGAKFPGYQVKVLHWDVLHGADTLSPSCT